jgi:hypothetical protein
MDNNAFQKHWMFLYKIGAISVFLAVLVMLTEIFLTALPDGSRAELTTKQLFNMYIRNWFMAMRNIDLLTLCAKIAGSVHLLPEIIQFCK